MNDRDFGRLEQKVDTLVETVTDIQNKMVMRREFDVARGEHTDMDARITELEGKSNREAWVIEVLKAAVIAVLALGATLFLKG